MPMFRLTWNILLLCQQHEITLSVRHIPGRLSVLADNLLIRNQIIGSEWSLHPGIVSQMFSIWSNPKLNLFVARHNNKLPAFVSSSRSQSSSSGCSVHSVGQAMGLRLSTNRSDATSASEVCTLGSLSNASSGSTSALPAVASNSSRPLSGFSSGDTPAVSTSVETPSIRSVHNHPEQVILFAWSLSSFPCETDSFLRQLPPVSARQLGNLPPASMTASGKYIRVGVVCNKLVLSKPLFNN